MLLMKQENLFKSVRRIPFLGNNLSCIVNFVGINKNVKGKNNTLNYKGSYLHRVKIIIKGSNNQLNIAEGTKLINCTILFSDDNCILSIGENCVVKNTAFTITHDSSKILLGDNTTCNGGLIYAGESKAIEIGEDCMFSSNIDIRTTDSHSIIALDTNVRENLAKDIIIGNHVWLGNSSKVWKGSLIGDNSIIGAGSIVTNTIDSNCIAVGVPAKKIKSNMSWKRELL